jgi:hypothetical protein
MKDKGLPWNAPGTPSNIFPATVSRQGFACKSLRSGLDFSTAIRSKNARLAARGREKIGLPDPLDNGIRIIYQFLRIL